MIKKVSGVTLLEVILVMAIFASFALLGINQYQQYRIESSFMDVKRDVGVLFQALGQYYQANCRTLSDASISGPAGKTENTVTGDLAPQGALNVDYTLANVAYPINIQTSLMDKHYLPTNWPTITPLVDADTYSARFIFKLGTKQAYVCWNFFNAAGYVKCNTADYFSSGQVGPQDIRPNQVAFWLVQISVHVLNDADGTKTLALLGPTGASCASSVPETCDGSPAPQYLIWQQLPTKSGSKINSDLWVSQQQEAVFNQQYTHDVMYELATPNYAPTGSKIDTYYLCGN